MNTDKIIDDFLSKKVIATSEYFTKNLLKKIEKENINDIVIDEFLAKEKIATNPNFTQDVMNKIRISKWLKALRYTSTIAATAACAAFVLFIAKRDKTLQLATEFQEIESTIASLNEYEEEFNSFSPNFCDYDLALYAMVEPR